MGACAQVLFCMVRSTLITPTEVDIKVLLYKSWQSNFVEGISIGDICCGGWTFWRHLLMQYATRQVNFVVTVLPMEAYQITHGTLSSLWGISFLSDSEPSYEYHLTRLIRQVRPSKCPFCWTPISINWYYRLSVSLILHLGHEIVTFD